MHLWQFAGYNIRAFVKLRTQKLQVGRRKKSPAGVACSSPTLCARKATGPQNKLNAVATTRLPDVNRGMAEESKMCTQVQPAYRYSRGVAFFDCCIQPLPQTSNCGSALLRLLFVGDRSIGNPFERTFLVEKKGSLVYRCRRLQAYFCVLARRTDREMVRVFFFIV